MGTSGGIFGRGDGEWGVPLEVRVWLHREQQQTARISDDRRTKLESKHTELRGKSPRQVALGHCCTGNEMKVAALLRVLHEDDWYLVAIHGSHRQFKHPTKRGRVTVAGKPRDDLAPGTVKSILKQSGLKR